MKTKTIILGGILLALFSGSVAFGAAKLVDGVDFARVGLGKQAITVSKIADGDTTCYVTRYGTTGAHAISCVK